jgi:hypothetical protein
MYQVKRNCTDTKTSVNYVKLSIGQVVHLPGAREKEVPQSYVRLMRLKYIKYLLLSMD